MERFASILPFLSVLNSEKNEIPVATVDSAIVTESLGSNPKTMTESVPRFCPQGRARSAFMRGGEKMA